MEDMARLALVEGCVQDVDKYKNILYELLRHINNILENPNDYQLRIIKSNILKELTKFDSFNEYLKYIGFERTGENFVYPHQSTLSNLRTAQGAIERKIKVCFGSIDNNKVKSKTVLSQPSVPRINLLPVRVLSTRNKFLLQIQDLFNNMLLYEDAELQASAREQIPLATLQGMAVDRIRAQQMQIKTGKTKAHDLTFEMALLIELMYWFKHEFFSWVDQPACEGCGADTTFTRNETMTTPLETCRVEVFRCSQCGRTTKFPRYNDVRTLLSTRRGRCGEWANCFTLLCRALGYDTRYVYDTTDHVWCEVYDFDSKSWLHCDPCEAKINTPLMYCNGWGKKLSYVIAVSRDDLQDVTWRYTDNHAEVLTRRKQCTEDQLIDAIMSLRAARQKQVSEARRRYLAKRTVQELVELLQERKASDYECEGRLSGGAAWRRLRGEDGGSHTFTLRSPGTHTVRYYGGSDKYVVCCDGVQVSTVAGWRGGAFQAENIMRKVEHDWKMVYLCRNEGESEGRVSWRVSAEEGRGAALSLRALHATYHSGTVAATVQFDSQAPVQVQLGDKPVSFEHDWRTATVSVRLAGGAGDLAWQHAQLARQPLADNTAAFEIVAELV